MPTTPKPREDVRSRQLAEAESHQREAAAQHEDLLQARLDELRALKSYLEATDWKYEKK